MDIDNDTEATTQFKPIREWFNMVFSADNILKVITLILQFGLSAYILAYRDETKNVYDDFYLKVYAVVISIIAVIVHVIGILWCEDNPSFGSSASIIVTGILAACLFLANVKVHLGIDG